MFTVHKENLSFIIVVPCDCDGNNSLYLLVSLHSDFLSQKSRLKMVPAIIYRVAFKLKVC